MMLVTGFRGRTQIKVRVGRSRLVSCPLHNTDLPMTRPGYSTANLLHTFYSDYLQPAAPSNQSHLHITLSENNKDLTPKPSATAHSLGCSH